jgi:hypothetical protein
MLPLQDSLLEIKTLTGFVHLKMDEDSVLVESILVGGALALR